jgi:hypothetical protein
MVRKPKSVEVIDEGDERVIVTTFADGEVSRTTVQPDQKPRRRPRRPWARAGLDRFNKTKRKGY